MRIRKRMPLEKGRLFVAIIKNLVSGDEKG